MNQLQTMEIFVNYSQKVSIFSKPEVLADNLACELLNDFKNCNRDRFNIALSGGNTPKVLYQKLSSYQYRTKFNWNQIDLFWGDERCVPPDNEESNFALVNQFLINNIDIPTQNIHRIKGEKVPEQEAVRYSKELKQHFNTGDQYPCFDIILLGLGSDGHTASLFPNSKNLGNKNYCSVAVHPETGQNRITLNLPVLLNARKIFFMVAGFNKAKIIKKIILEKIISKKYPASLLNKSRRVKWFLDKAAARYLI